MNCVTYALDPHSMMKTTGSSTQRSVGDRQVGYSNLWGFPTMEGSTWKMYLKLWAWGFWDGGKSYSDGCTSPPSCSQSSKNGKVWVSPPTQKKISSFPSSQNSPQKAGFLWGLKANVLRWGLILLFPQHSAYMFPGNTECRMCLEFDTTKNNSLF